MDWNMANANPDAALLAKVQVVVDICSSEDPSKVGQAFKEKYGQSFADARKAANLPGTHKLGCYVALSSGVGMASIPGQNVIKGDERGRWNKRGGDKRCLLNNRVIFL